ncbi:hypothetical protein [Natrinema salinisoli]|uniref:hypothetical protein n=1 Tax=Natrinema salinisoli TaxID=2878535 RepID=UPI001CF00CE7|nr:hypothetical protein [Natrinema salinisoli]
MARNELDVIDYVPVALYPVFVGIMLAIFEFSVSIFGGFDLNQVLYSGSGIEVTLAGALALASGGAIVATNEIDGSDYETWEYGAILAVFLFPLGVMLIPAVGTAIMTYELVTVAVWLIATVGSVWVAYTE